MNRLFKCTVISLFSFMLVCVITFSATGQDSTEYTKAMHEIKAEFGVVPTMFEVYPKHALAGAWENFKQLNSPQSKILFFFNDTATTEIYTLSLHDALPI